MSSEFVQGVRVEGSEESWHGQEQTIPMLDAKDPAKVMAAMGLENVRAVKLFGEEMLNDDDCTMQRVQTPLIGLYDTRNEFLGVHKDGTYCIHQPTEIVAPFFELINDSIGFGFSFGCRLRGAGSIFVLNFVLEGGEDIVSERHDTYLYVLSSFDGSKATTAGASTVRQVCKNTLNLSAALPTTVKTRFRHKRPLPTDDTFMRQVENAISERDMYKNFAEKMAQTRIAKDEAIRLLRETIFKPELKTLKTADGTEAQVWTEPSTRSLNRMEAIERSFETTVSEIGSDVTVWTLWNSFTRFADHEMIQRKTKGRADMNDNQVAFESNMFGASNAFKAKQAALMAELIAA